jgi:hypothetical protein
MPKLKPKMKLGWSEISGRIYAGPIRRCGTLYTGPEHDVTSDYWAVVHSVLKMNPQGITVTIQGKPCFRVVMQPIDADPKEAQAGKDGGV